MITDRINSFLDRSRRPTWFWERLVLVCVVELPAYVAALVVAPTWGTWFGAGVSAAGAVIAQAMRSGSARRAERTPTRVSLACERAMARWALAQSVLAAGAPVIAIAQVGNGFTTAAVYGALVVFLRWAWGVAYGRWRAERVHWRALQQLRRFRQVLREIVKEYEEARAHEQSMAR